MVGFRSTGWVGALVVLALGVAACGDDSGSSDGGRSGTRVDLEGFGLEERDKQAIESVAASGESAQASYAYDAATQKLTLMITSSSFTCEGPQAAEAIAATVTDLTATRMVWSIDGDDDAIVTWERLDSGSEGVVGVWKTDDPPLYLTVNADGNATLVGEQECEEERPTNNENCVELSLSGASLSIDGDLSDWDAVKDSGTITDPQGDHEGSDDGADLGALKVEIENNQLMVLLQVHTALSQNFQSRQAPNGGTYRIQVRSTQGSNFYSRVSYSPEAMEWEMVEPNGGGVYFAAADDGIEWAIPIDDFLGGSSAFDIVRAEAVDCGTQGAPCQTLDETEQCGFVRGL